MEEKRRAVGSLEREGNGKRRGYRTFLNVIGWLEWPKKGIASGLKQPSAADCRARDRSSS